jgi:hypothetical protein
VVVQILLRYEQVIQKLDSQISGEFGCESQSQFFAHHSARFKDSLDP